MRQHNYDLHTHTNLSDGSLTPEELLERASVSGIEHLAITDHDSIVALEQIINSDLEEKYGVRLISGCEFTCEHLGQMLHVVGLGFDIEDRRLNQHLINMKALRIDRAKKISEKLVKVGFPDLLDPARLISGAGQIGRPHFATAMVDAGLVVDSQQAFKKYLGQRKIGDVKMPWPSLESVLELIKLAGGYSFVAHPTKYGLTMTKIRKLVSDFYQFGGDGIEISYTSIKADQQKSLLQLVDKYNLMVSAGSDFHSPEYHWTKLGVFPSLPAEVNHVLDELIN